MGARHIPVLSQQKQWETHLDRPHRRCAGDRVAAVSAAEGAGCERLGELGARRHARKRVATRNALGVVRESPGAVRCAWVCQRQFKAQRAATPASDALGVVVVGVGSVGSVWSWPGSVWSRLGIGDRYPVAETSAAGHSFCCGCHSSHAWLHPLTLANTSRSGLLTPPSNSA